MPKKEMRVRSWDTSFTEDGAPALNPEAEDVANGATWPLGDEQVAFVVRFFPPGTDYAVDFDIVRTDGEPVVVGIKIRAAFPMERRTSKRGPIVAKWPKDLEVWSVRPRDVARLPLTRLMDLALLIAQNPMDEITYEHKNTRQATGGHLKRIARLWEEALASGKNPHAEIARIESRRLGEEVTLNRVYQWVHQARRQGEIPEKPRAKTRSRGGKRRK